MRKEHALDTLLVLLFGALMARGIIDALRFFGMLAVTITLTLRYYWHKVPLKMAWPHHMRVLITK